MRAGAAGPAATGPSRAAAAAADHATTFGYLVRLAAGRGCCPSGRRTRCSAGSPTRSTGATARACGRLRVEPAPGPARPRRRRARRADPRGGAVLPALLVRVVPAAGVADRGRRTTDRGPSTSTTCATPTRRAAGVVVPLPHMGNWDWAGAWACADRDAAGRPSRSGSQPERLYDEFVAYRDTLGMEILPLTGGDAALPRLEGWVRDGGLVCLLADRDLSRTSVEVELLRRAAPGCRAGPALLARRTGAPLRAGDAALRRRRAGRITFHPPVPHAEGDEGLVRDDAGRRGRVHRGLPRAPAGLAHDAEGVRRRTWAATAR